MKNIKHFRAFLIKELMANKIISAANAIIQVDLFLKSEEAQNCYKIWADATSKTKQWNGPKHIFDSMNKVMDNIDPIQKQKEW